MFIEQIPRSINAKLETLEPSQSELFRLIPEQIDKRLAAHILRYKTIRSIDNLEKRGRISRIPKDGLVVYPKQQIMKIFFEKGLDRR